MEQFLRYNASSSQADHRFLDNPDTGKNPANLFNCRDLRASPPMNAPPPLVDMKGRPISLDRQLASGGEGAVFALPNDSTRVAKVYHRPPTTQTVEKLTTMVRLANNEQLLALAAWPMAPAPHRALASAKVTAKMCGGTAQAVQALSLPQPRAIGFDKSAASRFCPKA